MGLRSSERKWVFVTSVFMILSLASVPADAQVAAASQQSVSSLEQGVIVEEVSKASEAYTAGIRVGDVISAWSRGSTRGTINSPFDWTEVLTEQAPRGTLTLRGQRGTEGKEWSLGLREWGLTVGPIVPAGLMPTYDKCRSFSKSGNHDEATPCWRSVLSGVQDGDPPFLRPWLLSQIAQSLTKEPQWQAADETFREAVERSNVAGQEHTAQLLNVWGKATQDHGDLYEAEQHHRQALAIQEKLAPESLKVADSLNKLGNLAYTRSDLIKAEEYFRLALVIREKLIPESLKVADSLNNLGGVAYTRSDLIKAEEYFRLALAIYQKLTPGSMDVADSLNNLGALVSDRGDLAKAEDYLGQSLKIKEKLAPGSLNVADTLNNIGNVAYARGDLVKAEDYHRQALAIRKKLAPESMAVAESLNNIGTVTYARGDRGKAEGLYRQSMAIYQKLTPDSLYVAACLNNIGTAVSDRDLDKAEEFYRQALAIYQKLTPDSMNVAASLNNIGRAASDRGDLDKTKEYYGQALAILEKLAPWSTENAETLNALGVVLRRKGQLEAAVEYFSRSVDSLESQTARLGGTEELRSGFRAKYANYYKEFADVLLTLKQPENAYQVLERSRARSLLAMLAERDLVFGADLPAEIQQARKLNAAAYDRTQDELSKLSAAKDSAQIEELLRRMRGLRAEREQMVDRVRELSPRFASLQYPQPLDLAATRQVLDAGTTLLSYSVSEDHTVLFVVRPTGDEPGLSVLTLPVTAKKLRSQVEAFRKLILERRTANDSAIFARGRELYDLLVGSAESLLATSERLLVIPDGPLQFLPFQALMRGPNEYLVERKPVHTVVSATVYAELKKMRRQGSKPTELVAFGDPRYPGRIADVDVRSAVERGFNLSRLPFSRMEVDNITALYPENSHKYLDAEATEERAKSLSKDVRYIHFAVHGLLDEQFPLNSALVLTIPDHVVDGKDNGLLQAWEIFEQVRLEADLVTLSACKTGLGQELSGEGLIGLTRAFQYAGARSILATLWSVDDYRTMELMKRFYAELRAGKSKDEALQAAQLELIHSANSSAPYYWAAFTLTGDWR